MSNATEKLRSLFLSHRNLLPQFLLANTIWLVILISIDSSLDLTSLSLLLLPFSVALNLLICLVSAIRKRDQRYSIAFAIMTALLYTCALASIASITIDGGPGRDRGLEIVAGYIIGIISGSVALLAFGITWLLAAKDDFL